MDRHSLNADPDPDPTFHFDAEPEPDPNPDPTVSVTHVGKSDFFYSNASLHCFIFIFFCKRHRCHNFQYFGRM